MSKQTVGFDYFIEHYPTYRGRSLAAKLKLCGSGSVKLADCIANLAYNLKAYQTCSDRQDESGMRVYLHCCKLVAANIRDNECYQRIYSDSYASRLIRSMLAEIPAK
jgi:hypothetical protein